MSNSASRPNESSYLMSPTMPMETGQGIIDPLRHPKPRRKPSHKRKPSNHNGTYRADVPFTRAGGNRVLLRAERGITPRGYLDVPFRFQCPPIGDFVRDRAYAWPTFSTLSLGDRSRPQGAALAQWPISTMFLWDDEPFVVWTGTTSPRPNAIDGVFEPQLFLDELDHIATDEVIFRLYVDEPEIWGSYALINSLATIIQITATQKPGEIGTEYPTVTFQEFREVTTQTKRRSNPNFQPHVYQAKTTDTLYEIARREMGRASDWRRIAAKNGIRGVSPSSAVELQAWLGKHHKTSLVIPAIKAHESAPKHRPKSSA